MNQSTGRCFYHFAMIQTMQTRTCTYFVQVTIGSTYAT